MLPRAGGSSFWAIQGLEKNGVVNFFTCVFFAGRPIGPGDPQEYWFLRGRQ